MKPIVAIVGRPNVGKSTLFNKLAGSGISIVKDTPGVTRDRIYADAEWLNKAFTMIDTGGIEPDTSDMMLANMREQAEIAIDTADVIIFITDVKTGLVDSDNQVAHMLRKSKKPVVLVVNKVDNPVKQQADVFEFYNLGLGEPFPISSVNQTGIGDMLDEVIKHFPEDSPEAEEDDTPRIAIIGKPNVGKSSLMNLILGEDRAIVTDIPGTTRDVIEEFVNIKGIPLKIVDTAGIRATDDLVEKIGVEKSREHMKLADLALVVLDSSRPLDQEDIQILENIDQTKSLVILNKTDLDCKMDIEGLKSYVDPENIINISALKGHGIDLIHDRIEDLVFEGKISDSSDLMITNSRHRDAIYKSMISIGDAINSLNDRLPYDFIEVDLKDAWDSLGCINGDTIEEDLLDTIFSNFCIGK